MKKALTACFASIALLNYAFAQKRATVFGDAWTGEVVATNDKTREITIRYDDKGKAETLTGVLIEGYKAKMKDGSVRELKLSEIPIGERIRVFAKAKDQDVGGSKVKIYLISRIDFLGKDDYSKLREVLQLDPSASVTLDESSSFPASNPLKIYLAVADSQIKEDFADWLSKWNKEQAAKYGSLEIVSDAGQSDVSLVVYKGNEHLLMQPLGRVNELGKGHTFLLETAYLVMQKGNALVVLWRQGILTDPDKGDSAKAEAFKGPIEREVEKRMKARSQHK